MHQPTFAWAHVYISSSLSAPRLHHRPQHSAVISLSQSAWPHIYIGSRRCFQHRDYISRTILLSIISQLRFGITSISRRCFQHRDYIGHARHAAVISQPTPGFASHRASISRRDFQHRDYIDHSILLSLAYFDLASRLFLIVAFSTEIT